MAPVRGILHLATLSSLLLLLPLAVEKSWARELRCDAICNFEDLREQCERCRLRYPMRFGKRSSPPENEALSVKEIIEGSSSVPTISRSSLKYLIEALLWSHLKDVPESRNNDLDAILKEVVERQKALQSPSSLSENAVGTVLFRRRKRSFE